MSASLQIGKVTLRLQHRQSLLATLSPVDWGGWHCAVRFGAFRTAPLRACRCESQLPAVELVAAAHWDVQPSWAASRIGLAAFPP